MIIFDVIIMMADTAAAKMAFLVWKSYPSITKKWFKLVHSILRWNRWKLNVCYEINIFHILE